MKKLWKFRYYGLIVIGLILLGIGTFNCLTNLGMILWILGFFISIIGICLQIIVAPNYDDLKCPDCGAGLKLEGEKLEFRLKFKKHST